MHGMKKNFEHLNCFANFAMHVHRYCVLWPWKPKWHTTPAQQLPDMCATTMGSYRTVCHTGAYVLTVDQSMLIGMHLLSNCKSTVWAMRAKLSWQRLSPILYHRTLDLKKPAQQFIRPSRTLTLNALFRLLSSMSEMWDFFCWIS